MHMHITSKTSQKKKYAEVHQFKYKTQFYLLFSEIADIAVTESLTNIVLETDNNQSAIRGVKTVKELKGEDKGYTNFIFPVYVTNTSF